MRAFQITIGARGNARLSFYCMAADSFTAQMQHLDLAEVGERVSVVAVGEESFSLRSVRHELEEKRIAEVVG